MCAIYLYIPALLSPLIISPLLFAPYPLYTRLFYVLGIFPLPFIIRPYIAHI
ncbi:hypothetical protein [Staphylococcus phage PT94]